MTNVSTEYVGALERLYDLALEYRRLRAANNDGSVWPEIESAYEALTDQIARISFIREKNSSDSPKEIR